MKYKLFLFLIFFFLINNVWSQLDTTNVKIYNFYNQDYPIIIDTTDNADINWPNGDGHIMDVIKVKKRFLITNESPKNIDLVLYDKYIFTSNNLEKCYNLAEEKEINFDDNIEELKDLTVYFYDRYKTYEVSVKNAFNGTINISKDKDFQFNTPSYRLISANYNTLMFNQTVRTVHQKAFTNGTYTRRKNYIVKLDVFTKDTIWKVEGFCSIYKAINENIALFKTKKGSTYLYNVNTDKYIAKLEGLRTSLDYFISEGDILYAVFGDELFAINMYTGKVLWKYVGDTGGNLFMDENNIYTRSLNAINKKTGELIWNCNVKDSYLAGLIGNYIICYFITGDNPEIFMIDKSTGEKTNYVLWENSEVGFCRECWDTNVCKPELRFIEQYVGNKTAAITQCKDGTYLYIFELQ